MTTANPLDNARNPIIDNGNEFRPATPLAIGSGHVDPNKALDPGLVYDTTPQDYVNLLCSLGYTNEQIVTLTRAKAYNCSNPSLDLNYPSFFAACENSNTSTVQKFRRIVANVGDGTLATYMVSVKAPKSLVVSVSPRTLVFKKKYEKQSYTVTIRCKRNEDEVFTHGELVWIEKNGKHRVRSPILASFN